MRPLAPPKGGRSSEQSQLVRPLVFLLLVLDVLADHLFVPTYGRDEVATRPEVLPHKVAAPFAVVARDVNRALPLDVTHHLWARAAVSNSVPSSTGFGASPLPSATKASSNWMFCRFSLMRSASYSPLHSTPRGDRSSLRWGESSGLRTGSFPPPTMPSADSCTPVREPYGSLSPTKDTMQASRGKLDRLLRTTAGFTSRTLDGYGLRDLTPARPTLPASYPVLVHRLAHLLHASFRPRLTTTPLRFANPSPPSGWIEDFHPQAAGHARHT